MNYPLLSFPLFFAALAAGAQVPENPVTPPSAAQVTETSRITRFVAGPGDRLQGLMLRNGTFVTLSPGLAQRIPPGLSKSVSVQVAGDAFSYSGNKTIQARTITIAGVAYADDALRVGPGPGAAVPGVPGPDAAGPAGGPPVPPREPRGRHSAGARPPRPCDAPPAVPHGIGPAGGPPPPAPGTPPPPPPDGAAPPPPQPDGAAPAPPPTATKGL